MLASNHVLAGASIGISTNNLVIGFSCGVISHIFMDALPHWGVDQSVAGWQRRFLIVAKIDGFLLILLFLLFGLLLPDEIKLLAIVGAFGALLPDLDKPFDYFFGHHCRNRPLWGISFSKFNSWLQHESPKRWWVELIGFLIAVLTLLSITIL